jgi:ribonuclease-3
MKRSGGGKKLSDRQNNGVDRNNKRNSTRDSRLQRKKTFKPTPLRFDGEPKTWQKITAADFDEYHDLSDTDDEVDLGSLQVGTSSYWSQSITPGKYYLRSENGDCDGTTALRSLHERFKSGVLDRIRAEKVAQPGSDPPETPAFHTNCSCSHNANASDSSSDESSSSDCDSPKKTREESADFAKMSFNRKSLAVSNQEIDRKRSHPAGVHPDIGFNEKDQCNDGPLCKCSWSARQKGIRHNKYAGEKELPRCLPTSSNLKKLYHYVLEVKPDPRQYSRQPTTIFVDGFGYEFDGFSVFFHDPLPDIFPQKLINKWTNLFDIHFVSENAPESYTVEGLELFYTYLFEEILEFHDLDRMPSGSTSGCPFYHCMPRFVRKLRGDGKELLPMAAVLEHFTTVNRPFMDDTTAVTFMKDNEAFRNFAQSKRGQLFFHPLKKPCTIRADLIEPYDQLPGNSDYYPLLTHFGVIPAAYAYQRKPEYQKALKQLVKMRHLLQMKEHLNDEDRQGLSDKYAELKRLRSEYKHKRDVDFSISSRGYYETGIYPDVVQHAVLLILATSHVRFHMSLKVFEEQRIHYKFKNRILLERAITHPSYRSNYGTNPDHAKNVLNNCGVRPPKVKAHMSTMPKGLPTRKKGINALMEIMSMQGSKKAEDSPVNHNKRLEFLGDAVVEFITTIHLFFMFPQLEEGGLATYRSSLVQNKQLANLAQKIGLDEFMLYAHGPDLCHEADLRHAMANAFEALMAAIYLDSGINECDRIFAHALYGDDPSALRVWTTLPEHPLKMENPLGDRHFIPKVRSLQLLTEFEENIGIRFRHIRLLAKAFTRRNVGFNNLTLGHNQRLEFLGDTILQLITTIYLYKHFAHHQEGHLSLLRTCLVSNKTQSVICDDLCMTKYLVIPQAMQKKSPNEQLRIKDKADLVEAFMGALYVDRGLEYCELFCRVCFFPRLKVAKPIKFNVFTAQFSISF